MNRFQFFVAAAGALAVFSAYSHVVVYPEYDARIERDHAYAVRVTQGDVSRALAVYNHCEKSILDWRTRGGDVNRRFCEFAFDGGPVRVDVAFCEDVKSYAVFPSRLGLKSAFKDGVLSVILDRPANFGIRINDYDKTILSVFADAPEDVAKVPRKGDPGVLFVDGWMDPPGEDGVLTVDDSLKEVYIAPGAVLNARLVVKSKGAYVHGRGMMLDPFSDIFRFDQKKNMKRGFLRVTAADVTVEDIKLVDSRTFNFMSWGSGVTFKNVKALSSMMCSDGITCGGSNFSVEGAWLYVGDNSLVISGVKGACLRDIAIGTSCNAIFPQGTNAGVVMENVDVFRGDEGLIRNVYNGVLRRNTKWNEMNAGEAKKEPGPQDLVHQRQEFFFKNLSAVDCVLFSRFFVGGNMGTLPKTFGFENVSVPFCTGKDDWRTIGKRDGAIVSILHDSRKWLDTTGYELSITNFWVGGSRLDALPPNLVKNADRVAVSVTNTCEESAIPAVADRHEVNWTCPFKRYIGASLQRDVRKTSRENGEQRMARPAEGENLLEDSKSTRSAWQRCPSWLVKLDATEVEDGERIYRLVQCEKNAGMQNVITDAFLRHGNGTYRLSFEARAKCDAPVSATVHVLSNEKRTVEKFTVPNDGEWHGVSADIALDFVLAETDLVSIMIRTVMPCDELCFRRLSFVKTGTSAFARPAIADSRYFADETGKAWIPVGCNICFDRNAGGSAKTRELYDGWMTKFAANGGNYMRVWLSVPFVDVMPERAHEFSDEATGNLKWLVSRAESLGIKLKFTFENFRMIGPRTDVDAAKGIVSFRSPVYAPYAKTVRDVFTSPQCFDVYLAKARHVAEAVGKSDALVAVELWNEINSVGGFDQAVVGGWSERMLAELKKLFPGKMTLQNLGSFSAPRSYSVYDWMAGLKGNDFMQMHRYLDPAAELDVCRGPMDVLCADAVRELLDRLPDRPAILSEVGAVKANHTGPSDLYAKDAQGMLLHDEIFAPFFAGSAGSGQPWHWDHQYIDGNNLWWHFARFAEAVKGVDPVVEHFRPFHTETRRLRIWGLRGERATLLWCRDKANTWEGELVRGESPAMISGEKIPFGDSLRCYLPWENRWVEADSGVLPNFSRSIVVRIADGCSY